MFNNKFNSKKADPLVEAAKAAMELGQKRRDAIAAVNEEFGVYNRNAVIREHLAAYDARIEEVFNGMKEGKPLDPVGKEDGDVDNDGDSDKSDKYLLNRRKAIGKSMGKRMEEGSGVSGEDPGMAVAKQAAKQTSTPASTPAPTKTKDLSSTISSARGAAGMYKEGINEMWSDPIDPEVKAFWDKRMAKSRAEKVKAEKVKSKKKESTRKKIKEESLDEAVSRKHFQQVADLIKGHESQEKRNELASHHAGIFSKQNPRFDHGRFHKAAGSTAHETKTVKESVLAAIRAKYMKEENF